MIFPINAYADNTMNTVGGIISGGMNMIARYQQNRQAQNQLEQIRGVLQPTTSTNRYFQGCGTLTAKSSQIFNLCESTPSTHAEADLYQMVAAEAFKHKTTYERYATPGNIDFINDGHSCMNEKIRAFRVALDDKIAKFTKDIDAVALANNNLKLQLQPQKEAILELEGYLRGGQGQESNDTRRFSSLFRQVSNDRSCGAFMDHTSVENFARKGLRNIEAEVNKVRRGGGDQDLVTNLLRNQGNIQSSIYKYANDLSRGLNANGVESSLDSFAEDGMGIKINNPLLQGSPAIAEVRRDLTLQHKEKLATFRRNASRLGDDSLTKSIFKEGEHNFNAKLRNWRNEKQNECLKRKLSLNSDEAFKTFTSRISHVNQTVRSRTNLRTLGKAILNHLENDRLSIQRKAELVEKVINKKNRGKVQIMSMDTRGEEQEQTFQEPASYLKGLVDLCLDEYSSIAENDEDQSFQTIEREAQKIYNAFKAQEREFPRQVGRELANRMINCIQDGQPIPYSVTSSSCNAEKISMSNPNFCLGQSVECAKTINSCFRTGVSIPL